MGIRACVYLKEVGGGTDLREKLLEKQNPNCKESLVYCKESLVSSKKQSWRCIQGLNTRERKNLKHYEKYITSDVFYVTKMEEHVYLICLNIRVLRKTIEQTLDDQINS